MSELFSEVKKINLVDHIQRTKAGKMIKSGNTIRINPCPLCDHHDCFTVYPADNSFKCFSCNAAGDIINFQRHQTAATSNLEAAKDLAAQYNINIDTPAGSYIPPVSSRPAVPATIKPTAQMPDIDPDRAYDLRAWAADYFHNCLMTNPAALKYQTTTRGHTIDTLKKHKIGMADRHYIKAALAAGFTNDDLLAVSLARRWGKAGIGQWILDGIYVYPHFINNKCGHFTIKDPKKQKNWQLKRPGADPDWICYGQDALKNDTIWMCEGENDRLTLMEKANRPNTIATIGNTATPRILDWIGANAAGKKFYLVFDPDDAGDKYTAKYGKAITNSGGSAHIIDLSGYQKDPTDKKDIDDILREDPDPENRMAQLEAAAKELTRPETSANQPADPADYEFASFSVIGQLGDNRLAFWSSVFRRTYFCTIKDFTYDQLCQIGGEEVRFRVSRTVKKDKVQFKHLKTFLIIKAAHTYLGDLKEFGQGIHPLSRDRLLIVNGDEAVIWDGKTFTPQEYPLMDRQFISWQADLKWTDLDQVINETLRMTRQRAGEIFEELLNHISQWHFAGSMDQFILTGWICAQVVQTAWEWRPQLWLSGSSGSGKTLMSLFIEAIAGDLCCRFEGNVLTEAGLRQALKNHAYMTLIDEFEDSTSRDKIIERLRSAGRGGKGAIGSTRQEAVFSEIRHMILVASIETGLSRAAEQYRYLQIHTEKNETAKPTIPSPAQCQELQIKLIAYALWAVFPVKQLVKKLENIPGHDNRWISSIALPCAMFAMGDDKNPGDVLPMLVNSYLEEWSGRQEGAIEADETALLNEILLASIRLMDTIYTESSAPDLGGSAVSAEKVYAERTIIQLISEPPLSDNHAKTLQAYGITLTPSNSLFLYPETIGSKLLTRTRWKGLNLRDILKRIPGATTGRARLGGKQYRGIELPESVWMDPA